MIYKYDPWYRANSKAFEAYICTEEIADILKSELPDEYQPYFLCADKFRFPVRGRPKVEYKVVSANVSKFEDFVSSGDGDFWLGSKCLSDELYKKSYDREEEMSALDINGLLHIQLNKSGKFVLPTRITQNWRIRNPTTGKTVDFLGYANLFRAFSNSIKKRLRFYIQKIPTPAMGIIPTTKMTALFADRVRSGEFKIPVKIGKAI